MSEKSLHAFEQTVLGSILLDNSQLALCGAIETDFVDSNHRRIFEAATRMIGSRQLCNALTVAELLESESGTKSWLPYTTTLVRETTTPANAPSYAARLRQESISRAAKRVAVRLQEDPTQEQIDIAIRELMGLRVTQKDWTCHQSEAIRIAAQKLMDVAEGVCTPGVPSGMRDIDAMTGGFHNGDLIVIPARPGMGKTAWMLNAVVAADRPVGVFSGEQGREQIGMRLLAIGGPISLHRMRTGRLDDDEWLRVTKVTSLAKDRPIWLFDKPAPTIDDIERQARAWKFERDIGIIFVDYLQKIRGGIGREFRLQIGNVCGRLKELALELDIPVVALSQVKREVESRPMDEDGLGRMPYMGDIAEAATIEAEADQIITLYRPEVYDNSPRFKGLAFANFCKNRHGPNGFKALTWRGEYLQFGDLAKTELGYQDQWSAAG